MAECGQKPGATKNGGSGGGGFFSGTDPVVDTVEIEGVEYLQTSKEDFKFWLTVAGVVLSLIAIIKK